MKNPLRFREIGSKPLTPALSKEGASKIDPKVVDEVVKSYYAAAVVSADAARTRAQNAYAIASAIAAAIVAAGVFGGIDDARTVVKVLGVASLLAWFAVAGLFMHAVAGDVRGLETADQPDPTSFVRAVIANVRKVRGAINARSRAAQIAMAIAILLTLAGIVLALFCPPPASSFNGRIVLSPLGVSQVKALCGPSMPRQVTGSLSASDLSSKFVLVKLKKDDTCRGDSTIRLKQSSIVAVSGP